MTTQLPLRTYTSAGGVVVEPGGRRVLVLLRPGRQGPGGQPEIRLPKGHVETGESHSQTALREVAEEAGLSGLEIIADLGRQTVEFDWQEHHYVRDEVYFLMAFAPNAQTTAPEEQFRRVWLPWDEALDSLTFGAEREWVRRAREALARGEKPASE